MLPPRYLVSLAPLLAMQLTHCLLATQVVAGFDDANRQQMQYWPYARPLKHTGPPSAGTTPSITGSPQSSPYQIHAASHSNSQSPPGQSTTSRSSSPLQSGQQTRPRRKYQLLSSSKKPKYPWDKQSLSRLQSTLKEIEKASASLLGVPDQRSQTVKDVWLSLADTLPKYGIIVMDDSIKNTIRSPVEIYLDVVRAFASYDNIRLYIECMSTDDYDMRLLPIHAALSRVTSGQDAEAPIRLPFHIIRVAARFICTFTHFAPTANTLRKSVAEMRQLKNAHIRRPNVVIEGMMQVVRTLHSLNIVMPEMHINDFIYSTVGDSIVFCQLVHYTSAILQSPRHSMQDPSLAYINALDRFIAPRDPRFKPPEWKNALEQSNRPLGTSDPQMDITALTALLATNAPLPDVNMRACHLWYLGAIMLEVLVGDQRAADLLKALRSGGDLAIINVDNLSRMTEGIWQPQLTQELLTFVKDRLHTLLPINPTARSLP